MSDRVCKKTTYLFRHRARPDSLDGELNISNTICPKLREPVKIPKASYKTENGNLIITPIIDVSNQLI